MVTSQRAEVESRVAEVCWVENLPRVAREDLELHSVAHSNVDKLVAERALLTANSKQLEKECETLATGISDLWAGSATYNRRLAFFAGRTIVKKRCCSG